MKTLTINGLKFYAKGIFDAGSDTDGLIATACGKLPGEVIRFSTFKDLKLNEFLKIAKGSMTDAEFRKCVSSGFGGTYWLTGTSPEGVKYGIEWGSEGNIIFF